MLKFLKSQRFQEIKYNAIQKILSHQNMLDGGMSIARSVSNFAQSKSKLSFIEGFAGAFNAGVKALSGDSDSFFSSTNGWEELTNHYTHQALFDIISSGLKGYPKKYFKFAYETEKSTVYQLPIGTIGRTRKTLFYRVNENKKKDILQFILKEKIKGKDSKIISITEKIEYSSNGSPTTNFDLEVEDNIALPSKTGTDLTNYIRRYLDQGINRSIILNGLPGVGKSSLAHNVFQDLGLNTLKFKYNKSSGGSIMQTVNLLLETFDIKCILFDDFDYMTDTTLMLSFLESIHRHCKVIIAITNSLRSFPAAVIRPGRMDEIRTIESLDEEVIKAVLGELYERFAERVDKWPIAYIAELAVRVKVNPEADCEEYITELQERINRQIKSLGGGGGREEK